MTPVFSGSTTFLFLKNGDCSMEILYTIRIHRQNRNESEKETKDAPYESSVVTVCNLTGR